MTKEATCTASGTRIKTCTVCGVTLKSETVAALGHSYGAWTTVTSATCTDSGSEKRTCSRCGASETRTVAALGHDIVWTTLSEATCETAGARKGECSRCGKAFKEEIPALGHDYHLNDPPSDIDPCLDLYMASQTCSRCGDTQELYSVGPPGHTWQQYESTAGPMANNRRLDGYSSYYYCSRCRGYALSDDGAPHPYDTPHGYYPS